MTFIVDQDNNVAQCHQANQKIVSRQSDAWHCCRVWKLEPLVAPSNRGVFSGTACTLAGGEPQQHDQNAGAAMTGMQAPESVLHIITFWRNGFTVGDGPLWRLDDSTSVPFLDVCALIFFCCFPWILART
jgi:hypothetical protein